MIKLVIFDLWRTLIPAQIDFDKLISLLKSGKIDRKEFIPRYERTVELKNYENFIELKKDFFNEFKEEKNELLEKELQEIFVTRFNNIKFYGDVIPALKKLKSLGYKIALLSNTENFIAHPLEENLGAKHYFDYFGYSYKIKALKPERKAFLSVFEQFDVHPSEALMVGDSLRSDVQGAKNIGINACWINRDNKIFDGAEVKPDFEIKSLSEIFEVLGELNGK